MKADATSKELSFARRYRLITTLILLFACVFSIAFLIISGLPIAYKWILAIASLIIVGQLVSNLNSFNNFYGLYMIGSTKGIGIVEKLSKIKPVFWKAMAEWGMVLGFGLASYFIFKKQLDKKMIVFGSLSILAMLLFVVPYSAISLNFINIPQINSRIQSAPAPTVGASSLSIFAYVTYIFSFLGGFVAFIFISLLYNALSILFSVIVYLTSYVNSVPNNTILNQQIPGVAPIIPGITTPIFAGVMALAVILIAHEFSHGVLARIAKVKIKSIGLVLLGVIPIGAFVEPDEKQVEKLTIIEQNRIFAAGIASNMVLTLVFFVMLILLLYYVTPHFAKSEVIIAAMAHNSSAFNVLKSGSVILKWNGYPISNLSSFKTAATGDTPNSLVSVVTTNGSYVLRANSTGKVGVFVDQQNVFIRNSIGTIAFYTFYTFVALSFLLNFLVAVVNLLPVPGFDGWRIFQTNMSKRTVNILAAIVVIAFILNVLPWIWEI